MQSSLGKSWERNQNTTACSEGISSRRKNDILRQYNDKFIMCSDRACGIILLSVTASWRQYQNKPRPSDLSPLSLPKTIGFIPSGAKTQKKEILPYPRCGFGACLRCG